MRNVAHSLRSCDWRSLPRVMVQRVRTSVNRCRHHIAPASHPVIPASHPVIPASHPVIPASHPVIPTPITSFPPPSRHSHPHHIVPVSHPVIPVSYHVIPVSLPSFPRRRESPRPVSGRRIHGNTISPRKVTGCIRRMVGGWRFQIPAFAGMTEERW